MGIWGLNLKNNMKNISCLVVVLGFIVFLFV